MKPIARASRFAHVVAAVAVLAAVSACGSDSSDESGGTPATTSHATDNADTADEVVTVSVHQTGGLKPTDETRVFSQDAKPPPGYTRHDVQEALAAADALAASNVVTPRMPEGYCADCYSYSIRLTFADGSVTSYLVTGGVEQPPVLTDLLSATS
jgi:hypothetical protein